MKNNVSLFLLILVCLTGCSPNDNNSTTATLTTFEQQFVGSWFIKSKISKSPFNNTYIVNSLTSMDTAHCKLWLKNSFYMDIGTTHFFYSDNGLNNCITQVLGWAGNEPYLNLNTLDYQVLEHTSNTLVLKNYLGGYENEYHLTKNYSDLYSVCTFTYSVEFNNPIPAGHNGSILYLNYTDNNGITQSVDMTGQTSWSQTVSQTYPNQTHLYSYSLNFPNNIDVDNSGNNWATLATLKITDSNGNILAQNGPKELCLKDYTSVIDCSNGTEPRNYFDVVLSCSN